MADCNDLFHDFHQEIRLLSSKRNRMKESKNILRDKIRSHFKRHHPSYHPKFFIQGSYKMKNGIRYKDDTADLDDGVYFQREPDVSPSTLQSWVYDAVEGHTDGGQEHRHKCIRVIYKGDYHIDLPVFCKTDNDPHPYIAVKNESWGAIDDPKELVEWFKGRMDSEKQLLRMTKYLKAWGDNMEHNMPSGLCMTILGEKNIVFDSREDKCLADTLRSIKRDLDYKWECKMPTTPKEDLFREYGAQFQKRFMSRLAEFIEDADQALREQDKHQASKLWRMHLGNRFPIWEDSTDDASEKEKSAKALAAVASLSKPWSR